MSDAKHWKQEISNSKGRTRFWLSLVIGWTVGALFIALALGVHEKQTSSLKSSDIENAKTIFAVSVSPSSELLDQLESAHQKGCIVHLITADSIQASFKVKTVPKDKITQNALLLNGSAWYPIP